MSHLRHSFALSVGCFSDYRCPLNRHSNTLLMYIPSSEAGDMQAVTECARFDETPMRSRACSACRLPSICNSD
jgi:hypothetical protein